MSNKKGLFAPQSEVESTFPVDAMATYYPYRVVVYIPKDPIQKLKPGMESLNTLATRPTSPKTNVEADIERSLRRTKKSIKDYALCNAFSLFVTFTFATERYDIERCKNRVSSWLKNQQKRTGKFEYIFVAEFHKDGALHFHGLLKNFKGKIDRATNPKSGKPVRKKGNDVYSLPSYTSGFTNVQKLSTERDALDGVARYLTKYITKDMPVFKNKNRYWASHGLRVPTIIYNPEPWYLKEKCAWKKENDYGTIMIYTKRSEHDKLKDMIGIMEGDE